MHILETLAASSELKGVELPTRDQISNRIHGRESKKRKLQMAALKLQRQREFEEKSPNHSNQTTHGMSQPYSYHPQFNATQSADASEQAFLDLFGPHLLYHSVYYHEYGLGMVVSTPPPSPQETVISPLNSNPYQPANLYLMPPINLGPSPDTAVTTLESVVLDTTQIPFPNFNPPSVNSDDTFTFPAASNSSEPSPHESVPFLAPSLPLILTHPSSSPYWTLLFLHTPPDENGYYMRCPLGCPDCIHGKVHLVVNRSTLISGLLGAVDVAHVGRSPSSHAGYWEPEQHEQHQNGQYGQNGQNGQYDQNDPKKHEFTFPQSLLSSVPNQDLSGLHLER